MMDNNYKLMFRFEDIKTHTLIEFLYNPKKKEYAIKINEEIKLTTRENDNSIDAQIEAWNNFSNKIDMIGRNRIQQRHKRKMTNAGASISIRQN